MSEVNSDASEGLSVPAPLVTKCSFTVVISRDDNYFYFLPVGQFAYYIILAPVVASVGGIEPRTKQARSSSIKRMFD